MKAIRREDLEWEGTKEEAKKLAGAMQKWTNDNTYYLRHGEICRPDYKAVRTREGWRVLKKSHFYYGTIHKGYVLHDGEFREYVDLGSVSLFNEATDNLF